MSNIASEKWRQTVNAWRVFFPLASIYAMVALPLSVYTMTTGHSVLPGVSTPLGHAHELLFGYTLAVATGYLLNRVPLWWVVGLLALWIIARVGFLFAPGSILADASNMLFAFCFILSSASRFLPTAKKWRNKVFGLNLIVIGIAAILTHAMIAKAPLGLVYIATYEAVLMFSLLMLMMGGRFIAPAAAGHIEKQGGTLDARVQPRLEGALIILLLAAALTYFIPGASSVSGILLFACGCVALVRLARWRLWECRDRIDLIALGLGYLWLAGGLMLTGASLTLNGEIRLALHAITVGAIGTLTLTVMSRVWMQRSGADASKCTALFYILPLIATAAMLRLGSGLVNPSVAGDMQLIAAGAWVAAFLALLLGVFLKYPGKRVRPGH